MFKNEVSRYFDNAPEQFKEILYELRVLVYDTAPDVTGNIKWGFAVFGNPKDCCYLRYSKNHITFGFYDFHKIKTDAEKLEGSGKTMRHIKIKTMEDIDKKLISKWLTAVTGNS